MQLKSSSFVSIAASIVLLSGASRAQQAAPQSLASTFVEIDERRLVQLTLNRIDLDYVSLVARDASDDATSGAPSTVLTAPALALQLQGGLTAVQNADGTWSAAASFLGGFSTELYVWRFELEPREGGGFARSELLGTTLVRDVSFLTPDQVERKARDIEAPCLFRAGAVTMVAASVFPLDRTSEVSERVVVVFPLAKKPVSAQLARLVTHGADPKVVRQGDSTLLAVRRPSNVPEAFGEARLAFLRSNDLVAWTEDELLGSATAQPAYSIAIHGGALWLATWNDLANPRVVVRSFDERRGNWASDGGIGECLYRGTPASDGVWFRPSARANERRPMLLYACRNGSIARD